MSKKHDAAIDEAANRIRRECAGAGNAALRLTALDYAFALQPRTISELLFAAEAILVFLTNPTRH